MSDLVGFMADLLDIWTQVVKTPYANRRPTAEELDIFGDRVLQLIQEEKSYGNGTSTHQSAGSKQSR